MTPKQKEISLVVDGLKDKDVNLWYTVPRDQHKRQSVYRDQADLEGTVVGSTGTYLLLKNVILWNGKFNADYHVSIGRIGKIVERKPKAL
jgi:hypothetical protein